MQLTANNIELKKHLGQYFSGHKVAKLLAYLCQFDSANTIIDPMCGSGDMLLASSIKNSKERIYKGVEIDKRVVGSARNNLLSINNVELINGNVFDLNILESLAKKPFDLVITNPPYVRYQSFSNSNDQEPNHLSSTEIRRNLLKSLNHFSDLSEAEKEFAAVIINNYSGLSDLAVPSWILCSLLTKHGGRIGMVVPNTWLNRNYADIIQYLLQKWFCIEYIIEDGNSSWFPTAQVKTTLLIAKRVPQKETIFDSENKTFIYCTLYSAASTKNSLVGNVAPGNGIPESEFIQIINNGTLPSHYGSVRKISLRDFSYNLHSRIENSGWYSTLEKNSKTQTSKNLRVKIPSELSSWLGNLPNNFVLLEDIGVSVSQGLRTGANSFFYLQKVEEFDSSFILKPDNTHHISNISLPKKFCLKVLKKQSELDDSYSLKKFKPSNVLLYIQDSVLRRDYTFDTASEFKYEYVNADLEKYIQEAEQINIGKNNDLKFFPELSAVKPNIRKYNPNNPKELPRFWYMIPPLTQRHCPELFVPRVNGQTPKTRLNAEPPIAIDANFSTIWISNKIPGHDKYSILALLNSTWCVVAMEEYGTVMGGGALKLEATHIKRIPIPTLSVVGIQQLSVIGKKLLKTTKSDNSLIEMIDSLIFDSLNIEGEKQNKNQELQEIKRKLFQYRNG